MLKSYQTLSLHNVACVGCNVLHASGLSTRIFSEDEYRLLPMSAFAIYTLLVPPMSYHEGEAGRSKYCTVPVVFDIYTTKMEWSDWLSSSWCGTPCTYSRLLLKKIERVKCSVRTWIYSKHNMQPGNCLESYTANSHATDGTECKLLTFLNFQFSQCPAWMFLVMSLSPWSV